MKGPIVALIAAGTFILGGLGGCAVGCSIGSSSSGSSGPRTTIASDSGSRDDVSAEPTTSLPAVPPKPSDFRIDVTVTEQKCFGSAGCNYELNIEPVYIGTAPLSGKWKVIYSLHGGEDPQTGYFTIDGDNVRWDESKRLSGSAGTVFTAEVTRVLKEY